MEIFNNSIGDNRKTALPRGLGTIRGQKLELIALYKKAKMGKMDIVKAKSLAWMIQVLSSVTEKCELEARIEVLEKLQK